MRLGIAKLLPFTLLVALLFFVAQGEWNVVATLMVGVGVLLWQPSR